MDFEFRGTGFASCSIDNSARIWDITRDKNVVDAILESRVASIMMKVENVDSQELALHKKLLFNTRAVHKHYRDCVTWFGDASISKSLHDALVLWLCDSNRSSL